MTWKNRYKGDPDIIGKTQYMNGVQHTIIGVAPEKFHGTFIGYSFNFWVPTSMQETFDNTGYKLEDRGARWIEGYAFLKPGVTRAAGAGRTFRDRETAGERLSRNGSRPRGWAVTAVENAVQRGRRDFDHARHHRGRRFLCPPHRLRQREQSPPRAITRCADMK